MDKRSPVTARSDDDGDKRSHKKKKAARAEAETEAEVGVSALPDHWPDEIRYLVDHIYSHLVSSESRAGLARTSAENINYAKIPPGMIQSPSPLVSIRMIGRLSHPAYGQRGLFAAQHLAPDSFIVLYLGYVHSDARCDTNPTSDYDLSLDRDLGLSVDAEHAGNESRFANDYRGIAERPNAEFRDVLIRVPSARRAGGVKWERRCSIFVLPAGRAGKRKSGIAVGEEILVSYGKGYWEGRGLMPSVAQRGT